MVILVGVGVSFYEDSFSAGKEAATQAMKMLGKPKADVLIVFAAPKFKQQELLNGCRSESKFGN